MNTMNTSNRAELTVSCTPGPPRWAVGEVDGFSIYGGRPMAVFVEEYTGMVSLVPVEGVRFLSTRCPQTMQTRMVRDMDADEIIFKLFYNTIYLHEVPEQARETLEDIMKAIREDDGEAMFITYKDNLAGGLIADKYVDEKTAEEIIHVKRIAVDPHFSCREEIAAFLLRSYMNHYDNMKMFAIEEPAGCASPYLVFTQAQQLTLPPCGSGRDYTRPDVRFVTENIILKSDTMQASMRTGFLKDIYSRRRKWTDYPDSDDPTLLDLLGGKDICGLEYILRKPVPYMDSTIYKVRRKFGREGDRIRIVNVLDDGRPVIDIVGSPCGVACTLENLKKSIK